MLGTTLIYSQNLKVYSGNYSSDSQSRFNDYGKTTYDYFENENSERIKNGKFIFKGSQLYINGQFINGLRNGLWKLTYKNKHPFYKNYEIILTAMYKNGKLNGNCNYVKTLNFGKTVLEKSSATFKDNLLVGQYIFDQYYDEHEASKRIIIKYTQNLEGNLNGEYRTEFYQTCCNDLGQIEDVINFDNGIMTSRLCREKENGKVYYKYENGNYSKLLNEDKNKKVFSSSWSVYVGCDFWIGSNDQEHNGMRDNPLYTFTEGINAEGFISLQERTKL